MFDEQFEDTITVECKPGNHSFIVTHWDISLHTHKALGMRCQHCLHYLSLERYDKRELYKTMGTGYDIVDC
jgi:hypothetical protein